MSFEDEFENFMQSDEPKPEDVFSMVTIMPKKKIKVTAYLEDKEGDRVLVSEIAESLTSFVNEQMRLDEATPINSQMFPLCGQFMMSIVPRFVGMHLAHLMFQAGGFRQALLTLSLSSTLFMQYIQQHELKVITETTELSDYEVENYLSKSREFDEKIHRALTDAFGGPEEEQ